MVAAAGRDQHRREETADGAERRQAARILQHGERAARDRQHDQQREGEDRRDQFVQAERGESRQVQDAQAAALEAERIHALAVAQPPADREQHGGDGGDREQAELDRKDEQLPVHRVLQQEGDAEERDDDAELDRDVAGREPVAQETECRFDRASVAPAASGSAALLPESGLGAGAAAGGTGARTVAGAGMGLGAAGAGDVGAAGLAGASAARAAMEGRAMARARSASSRSFTRRRKRMTEASR